uniref:Uncharacterized protein n=1 Tax=Quercus lobata TaxID=97700 RepID=A0A7N2MIW9_QUELO
MWPNKFEQVHQTSTLSDILGSSRKDVVEELCNAYVAMKTITAKDNDSEYWEDMLLSDKAYTQFIKFLDCGREIVEPWKTPEEVVKVGDYVVPMRLAPIIKHLLSKHGDVSAKSTVSPMAKQYLYIVLCECLYSMANTRVVDITKDLLLNWWTSFKILESTRFEIQFALNHLKRVADAYFGRYVERRLENIDGDIAKLSIELQNLLNKIETLKNKRDLESVKSKSIEECLREASALQYGKASSGLLRIL